MTKVARLGAVAAVSLVATALLLLPSAAGAGGSPASAGPELAFIRNMNFYSMGRLFVANAD